MKKTILSLAVVTALTGCATGSAIREKITGEQFDQPVVEQSKFLVKEENTLLPPAGGPIPVAVYSFRDMTGQRKSVPNIASLSSAVTQGADGYLVKALQDVGNQRWFIPLERVGLENLIKERQMIRQMREQYQGKDAKPLPPMLFAGIIIEGGIVGYDSNTQTGGSGMRIFGIGAQTQYQSDTVTVTLRTVSVSTGEVLTTTTVTKTVLSYMDKVGVLRFVSSGEQAIEAETGASINESINKATNLAIQAAVVNTIREGARKGHWSFKEDKKNELVQPQAVQVQPPAPAPAKEQPVDRKDSGADKPAPAPEAAAPAPIPQESKEQIKSEPKKNTKQAIGSVNVRETNISQSTIIAVLKSNEEVEIIKEEGRLYLIKTTNDKRGWVLKEFLK